MKKVTLLLATAWLVSCGGTSSEKSAEQQMAEEKAVVDSVSTAVDASIRILEQETASTNSSIDSLLNGI